MAMNDPNKAIDFIIKHGAEFAKAKSDRVYLELYRKTKKAQLMLQCKSKTVAEKEAYAYAHKEMIELIGQLRDAVDKEEALKALIDAAKLRTEIWRTEQANNRGQDRALR
jgi:hypothetical protein